MPGGGLWTAGGAPGEPALGEEPLPASPHRVAAVTRWGGRSYEVRGTPTGAFIFENGQVRIQLRDVTPLPPDVPSSYLWVAGEEIRQPHTLPLRMEIWELPGGNDRDWVLRSVSHLLNDFVREYGVEIQLGRQWPNALELTVVCQVPPDKGTDYLASWLPLRHRCNPQPAPWQPPRTLLGIRSLGPEERAGAGYHLGHLPNWLESRRFWSVLMWTAEQKGLRHLVQFSLPDRFKKAVEQRFRFQTPPPDSAAAR